jgi:signal transduction histidine kinase
MSGHAVVTRIHEPLTRRTEPAPPRAGGRWAGARLLGRFGPIALLLGVAAAMYWWGGTTSSVAMLVKLWVAYCVAFIALASLAKLQGGDATWAYLLPIAVCGIAIGGFAGAAVVFAPNWQVLLEPLSVGSEWAIGAAFSVFFVGVFLVTAEARRREQADEDARRQLLETRLQTLTAQIEPHFLMNTLANLRYLIRTDSRTASRMLEHLADFLQGALERSRAPHSTLGQELELVESYLSIMQIRLGARLRFTAQIPDDLRDVRFPPLLLQTLVENAVTHGIEPSEKAGTIEVTVHRDGNRIVVRVADDGVGIGDKDCSHGLGLSNTRERLVTFYRGRASFDLAPGSPSGTVAAITIPAES